ncbi:hypothetical protein ACFJIX_17835 [Roseateles sp. UC29_93]|uniref:hypothetical protein n=1 Tax=Roseateles sp. UC29_93 TaxID=3350177 RepID=UPI00366E690B
MTDKNAQEQALEALNQIEQYSGAFVMSKRPQLAVIRAALESAAPSAAEPVGLPEGFMLISQQQVVALEQAEIGMRAIAVKQRQMGDVIEPVRTINDAAKIAKVATDRVYNVIHCLDLNAAPPAPSATSAAHVGDTGFEGWLSGHQISDVSGAKLPLYHKQDLRDAYWAGYRERATLPAVQPEAETSAEKAPPFAHDSRCNYIANTGRVCRKCHRVHDGKDAMGAPVEPSAQARREAEAEAEINAEQGPLLVAAREMVAGSTPLKECHEGYVVPAELWLALQGEVMECLRRQACTAFAAQADAPVAEPVAPEYDVRKILIDVVPGVDGMGHEVYAESVTDVEELLTKLSVQVEDLRAARPPAPEEGKDAASWAEYVAGMVVAYLGGGVDDERIKPIAGIISQRLRALAPKGVA